MQPCLVQSEFSELGEESYILTLIQFLFSICSGEHRLVWYKPLELYRLTQTQWQTFRVCLPPPSKQFFRQRDGSSYPLQKGISNNSQKQNQEIERWNILKKAFAGYLHIRYCKDGSLCFEIKQNQTLQTKSLTLHPPFFHGFYLTFGIMEYSIYSLFLRFIISKKEIKNHINETQWRDYPLIESARFLELSIFSNRITLQPLTNREKKCNGQKKLGKSCETNVRRKYIQEKKGEKNYWRKKIQTRIETGKKEIPYLTATRDFCPPTKISFSISYLFLYFSKLSQGYFSSYLFPYFSLSQNTHTFPLSKHSLFSQKTIFSPNADCVLNQVFVLLPSSKKKLGGTQINDRIFKSKIDLLFSFFSNFQTKRKIKKLSLRRWSACFIEGVIFID